MIGIGKLAKRMCYLAAVLLTLLPTHWAEAQTTLVKGQIAIVACQLNAAAGLTRSVSFVSWVPLEPNTVINLTNNGFHAAISATTANNARAFQQIIRWTNTTGTTLAAGTLIKINTEPGQSTNIGTAAMVLSASNLGSNGTVFSSSTSGGKLFLYQGADFSANGSPATFNGNILFGVTYFGAGTNMATYGNSDWPTSGTGATTYKSYLPTELSGGNYELHGLGTNASGFQYNAPRDTGSSFAVYQASVCNPANWAKVFGSTDYITVDETNFTIATPIVATTAATSVGGSGATLNGTVDDNDYATSPIIFQYSTSSTLASGISTVTATPSSLAAGSGSTAVSKGITGLTPSTTYYFRVVATNTRGTSYGSILSFTTTSSAAPVFVSSSPQALTVCQNAGATDIKSYLHVNDVSTGNTETWTQASAPAHGSLSITGATASSGSTNITPGGTITYAPTAGYSGSDIFAVQVSNGSATAIMTINVTVSALPNAGTISGTGSVLCSGATVSLTSSGSTGGVWSSTSPAIGSVNASTGVARGLSAGTTTISYGVTNSCGTVYTAQVLTVNVVPAVAAIGGTASVTAGSTTTLTNGTSGGTWSSTNTAAGTVNTSGVVTGIAAGTTIISYSVTNSCGTTAATINVTVSAAAPLSATVSSVNVACNGASTGSASVSASGGTSPYGYSWAPSGGTAATASSLAAGTYTCTITDAVSAVITRTVSVTQPSAISTSVAQTNVACFGGSTGTATITATGGTTGPDFAPLPVTYTYSWAPTGGTAATATGLAAGTYTCTVTDLNGCAKAQVVTITQPASAITSSVSAITNVSCYGLANGAATVNASGGTGTLHYAWAPSGGSAATATGLASGPYTITITDDNLCARTQTVTVTQPSAFTMVSVANGGPVCAGSTLTLNSATSGGATPVSYAWSGPSSFSATGQNTSVPAIAVTAAGIYTVTATDANGCIATGTRTTMATVNTRPVISSIGNNGPVCSGANLTFSSSAGLGQSPYAYSWSGPNTFSSTAQNPVISGATTAATGAYTLNVTDANGCTSASSSTTSAVVNQRPVIASIGNSGPVCAGAALSFNSSASGGTGSLSYAWNGPLAYSSTAANPAIGSAVTGNTGIYTLTVTDGVGCRATGTNTTAAVVNSRPVLSGPANNGPICAGSTLSLSSSASGGTAPLTFSWTGPNSYSSTAANSSVAGATTAASGIYTVMVTDANGCTPVATNTTSATVRATPVIASIGNNGPICAGFNLNLSSTASGGTGTLSYTWSGPASYSASGASPSISGATPAATGNYVLTVSDVNNCTATGNTAAVVNAIPVLSSISNNGPVCAGATLNLNSSASGGTAPLSYVWSGPNSFTSTNSSASITGASTLATGTYTLVVSDANGCHPVAANTTAAIVNPGPDQITGNSVVCEGLTIALSNTTTSGTWSSSNSGVATVDASGIVSGNVQGVAVISYVLATGCYATKEITVNPMPGAITGPASICAGANITLGNSLSGGTWSSSNTSVATADITTGVITGLAAGTATISYTSDKGCVVTTAVPVSNIISAIAGGTGTCTGLFLTLSDATPGGVWSTSNPAVVAVNSAGVVQALSGGTAFITYTVGACYRTQPMTISTSPPDIAGDLSLCIGNTSALSNVISGGTWISASAFIASVSASGGVVTGVASGTVNITYALSATCRTSVTVTVDPSPVVTGPSLICQGSTVAFSSTSIGGSWLSGNPAIAMVDASGNVTGVSTGNTTLTYTVGSGCSKVVNIAVSPLPAAISGAASICVGAVTVYTDATTGGTLWSSSNTSVATIGSASGLVTGIGVGTAVITYTINTGCVSTRVISINALPDMVTGNPAVCVGSTTTLVSAPAGGTWSSASTAIATVSATGVVTGATPGAVTISYSQGVGCNRTQVVTVSAAPPVITGTTTICLGSTSNLANSVSGGTWSSSDAAVANVDLTTDSVTGVATGTATITYTAATGCMRTTNVTVNTAPAITGNTSVCAGTNTNLANATSGGVWSSSNTAVATINSASGAVTTIAPGTATITYTLSAGCSVNTILTANTAPATITGTMNVNVAGTTILSNTVAGGAWTSSDPSLATVDVVTGVVTGVASGNLVVTYTIGSCAKTTAVTVNPEPDAIVGSPTVCVGLSINLSNPQIGLSWTSSNPGVATIGSSSGVVTGVTPGTTVITFTALSGAIATKVMTVNPQPSAITGAASVCVGAAVSFTNPDAGGVWTSNNTPVAAVSGSTGVVSGMSSGVAVITYSLAGCIAVKGILVNPLPNSISGTTTICAGSTGTLADVTPGGTWSSNTLSVATVNATGVVSGLTAGTSVISYTLASGCAQTKEVTVNVMPSITGNTTACIGSTTALSNPGGGNWTSSNVSVATIGAGTGVVTGVTAGTSSITYTLTAGCKTSTVVTVVAGPANITGATSVCVNAAVTLANVTPSGTWSSNNTGLATVGAATGMVTGVAAGASQITYTIANGCFKTYNVTIKAIPVPISGNPAVCVGGVTMMSDPTPTGASWVSSNTGVATIAGSGAVTGITPGTTTITYNLTSGCYATTDVTVSAATSAGTITGPATVGIAASSVTPVLYSNAVTGGLWTSSNTARATIGSASGLVRGLSAGAITLTYTALTGCKATLPITITSPRAGGNAADVAVADRMQLFPNPTSGSFTVNAVGDGILKVYTLEGKEVIRYAISEGNNLLQLPHGLAAGVYMCSYTNEKGESQLVRLVYQP